MLDLGSGGGIDVILSAKRVGPSGIAYGLDMTDEMLALARQNAPRRALANVHFLKGVIEQIPLPADSVDVVISNCVINLSVDKPAVLTEIARVLKPGGRIGISDVVAEDRLSPEQRAERGSYVGCIAGALSKGEYEAGLEAAGFEQVSVEFTHEVADGMHGAIVKAVKTREPERRGLPVVQPAARAAAAEGLIRRGGADDAARQRSCAKGSSARQNAAASIAATARLVAALVVRLVVVRGTAAVDPHGRRPCLNSTTWPRVSTRSSSSSQRSRFATGSFLLVAPSVLAPRVVPAITEAVDHVRRVRVERHVARRCQCLEPLDRRPQLHALVRRARFRTRELESL